ncbi:MAG: hypothetical protein RR057_00235, partial [Clostridia bacterium]
ISAAKQPAGKTAIAGLIEDTKEDPTALKGMVQYSADFSTRTAVTARYIKATITYKNGFFFASELAFETKATTGVFDLSTPTDVTSINAVPGAEAIAIYKPGATVDYSDHTLAMCQFTRVKWDSLKKVFVILENIVNPYPGGHTGTYLVKDGELAILTSTMGNDGYAFAGAKWIMRGLVPGDFVYLYGNEDDGVKLSFIPNDTLSIYTPVLYPTGYVKTNLVAQYDADHNTKDGLDRHAKAWYDLTGNGNDIAALPATNDCYFKDGYYTITKEEVLFPKTIVDTVNSGDFTVELVLGDVDFIGPSFGPLLNCANDNFSLFWRSGSGILELKTAGNSNARPKVPNAASLAPNSTITVTFK